MSHFSAINVNVTRIWCPKVLKSKRPYAIPATKWHGSIIITSELCKYFGLNTHSLIREYGTGEKQ